MSATTERDLACRAAKVDFARALSLARKVSEPWFRCQALAYVARFAPEERVVKIAEEAIAAALAATEPYVRVAATAWPLRALIERNQGQKAVRLLPSILDLCPQIEGPKSRGDALFLLWEALFPMGGNTRRSMTNALVESCVGHEKGHWVLREAALSLAFEDREEAFRVAALIPEGKSKRQAEKRLAEGQKFQVKSFFH